jgi:hypothetical protein
MLNNLVYDAQNVSGCNVCFIRSKVFPQADDALAVAAAPPY